MQIVLRLSASEGRSNWLSRSRILGTAIKAILDTQVRLNRLYLARHRGVPPLYASGVRYAHEPKHFRFQGTTAEEFALIPILLERGWGDCLAAESLVLLPNGKHKPICKLRQGDLVATRDGDRPITTIAMTGFQPLQEYSTFSGARLVATEAHRFATQGTTGSVQYVRGRSLEPGQTVLTDRGTSALKAINGTGNGPTYDITVDGAHHYYAKAPGSPEWLDVHNCDDLAPYRVAELQHHGEPARIRVVWKRKIHPDGRKGRKYFHVVVRRADGSVEDPSALLGMHD